MSAAAMELTRDIDRDPESYLDERDRRRLQSFTRRMVDGYIGGAHINRLVAALEAVERGEIARLIVTMPPRHSKSLTVSENFPAWYLGRNPDKRIITVSHTAQLAYTFSRRVRNKIQDLCWPFPDVTIADDKGAVQAWDIADHAGGYIAVGVGGTPVGQGFDCAVIDDPLRSAADADSATVRDALWEWYQGTFYTRRQPGAAIILTATRWHADDLTGRLLAEAEHGGDQWHHLHMPAINETGEALWPEYWPLSELEKARTVSGSRVWESQYQGRPTPAEGGMFKRHWWQRYRVLPPLVKAELSIDSAFKEGVAADYSAIALWGKDATGSAYLVRVWRARAAFPDLIRLGHDAHAWAAATFPHLHIPLVVEDKASGQSAIQVWKQPYYTKNGVLPALPVIAYAIKGTQSKTARAEGVTPIVEGGRAFIPEQATWLDDWLTEHEAFPLG
ncbi:MAG: phage terminase large subunit, partial [Thermomicrobiales bacterium]